MDRDIPPELSFSAEEFSAIENICSNILNAACCMKDDPSFFDDFLEPAVEQLRTTVARFAYTNGRRDAGKDSFKDGKREGMRVGMDLGLKKAAIDHKEDLEKERVWGYDVGFALACEIERSRRFAEACSPSPCSPLPSATPTTTQTIAVDVDAPDVLFPCPSTTEPGNSVSGTHIADLSSSFDLPSIVETDVPPPLDSLPPSSIPENEAAANTDSAILENRHAHSAPSPPFVRDFSDLRSSDGSPFSSLRRRHRRFHCPRRPSSRVPRPSPPQTFVLNIYSTSKTARADSRDRRPSPAAPRTPSSTSVDPPSLAWDHDPRLRDLSRALTALGWVRPG
ncbi:hypothetical protein R3P38DRAFT_2932748 [Favolaschia claudopus]|uniref:Uncharacterized protein n=1 Tax=Favolaschia claudopus TaxID=2862362 RepID=A0AAW0BUQ2_9AGAR